MKMSELDFDKAYYTFRINSIGEYVITQFKIRSLVSNGVETLNGHHIGYDDIFRNVQDAGKAIDEKLASIRK